MCYLYVRVLEVCMTTSMSARNIGRKQIFGDSQHLQSLLIWRQEL